LKISLGFYDPGALYGNLNLGKRLVSWSSYYLCVIEGVKYRAVAGAL
jgi:hypothetical protein